MLSWGNRAHAITASLDVVYTDPNQPMTTGTIAEGATLRLNVVYSSPMTQLSNPKITGTEATPHQTANWSPAPGTPIQQPDGTYLVRFTVTPSLYNFHNDIWTLNGQVDWYRPPMMGNPSDGGTVVAAPITVTFKSMVVTSIPALTQSGNAYCLLGTGQAPDRTVTYTIDHAVPVGQTSVPGQATLRFHDSGG